MNATRICSVEGCESKHDARGYCASHYNRWKRYGDPRASAPKPEPRPCGIDGCGRPHRNWGYCNMHAQRFYKHGDPLKVIEQMRSTCVIDLCGEPMKGHGYCVKHLRRVKKTGSPFIIREGGRPPVGQHPGWDAAHVRVKKVRGKASSYKCVDCGGAAAEWSYDNLDAHELIDQKKNIAYSLSVEHYEARCVPCHRKFDAAERAKKEGPACMVLRVEEIEKEI